ncbi:hypothetical protein [Actinoplanes sp. N902-109]|uniref:hypothetical protein n=1 Tax=Actinoplanes sp. (strain N902-109) TaxID=649831 RepID=UPI0003A55016|nr:hypothetical protein [Actinoplanes sp. N902-109]
MADTDQTDGLWSWSFAAELEVTTVCEALSTVLQRPVATLGAPVDGAMLCDVWHTGGDFPTSLECFLAPSGLPEHAIARAVAARLGVAVLLPDDTLHPTRYLRISPDGGLRAVHVDESETDDGAERRHARPCTGADPACALAAGCATSRWKPDPTPEAPAPR